MTLNMTVAQAGVYCADLQILVKDSSLESRESERILALLQQAGPCVETPGEGLFYLEASALIRLYRNEEGIIAKVREVLKTVAYPIMIGIGSNKLIARIAAHLSSKGECISVPAGEERDFLAPLRVDHLQLPVETVKKLHELGIRTIQHLSRFPPHELTLRFGDEIIALAKYARGEDPSLFLPERLNTIRMVRRILDFPLFSRTLLLECLKEMFDELLEPLRRGSEGGKGLNVIFFCQDGSSQTVTLRLDNPSGSASMFCRQATVSLESITVSDGVIEILVVLTERVRLDGEQLDLQSSRTIDSTPSQKVAKDLSDRGLYSMFGNKSKLPEERFTLNSFSSRGKKSTEEQKDKDKFADFTLHSRAGMRLLSTPKASTIETQAGRLLAVYIKGKRYAVVNQRGPWRLSGGWWSRGFERLYYDVETSKHQSILVFYDLQESTWYLQGVFD